MKMKSQKAITLTSLVVYIIVMIMVIGVMSGVSFMFYSNTQNLKQSTKDIIEFNNFNNYFVKEIKIANNKVDQISEDGNYIVFTNGNSFSFHDNSIFYNELKIANNVNSIKFNYDKDENEKQLEDIIIVDVKFNDYEKQMKYMVEDIY